MKFFSLFRHKDLQGKMLHIRKIQNIFLPFRLSELFFKSYSKFHQHLHRCFRILQNFQNLFLRTLEIPLSQLLQNPLLFLSEFFHPLLLLFLHIRRLLRTQSRKSRFSQQSRHLIIFFFFRSLFHSPDQQKVTIQCFLI